MSEKLYYLEDMAKKGTIVQQGNPQETRINKLCRVVAIV